MTDFEKVRQYYNEFDEKNRLNRDNSGKLEYEMTIRILEKYLPNKATILDLGAGAGTYTFPLAEKGYEMYLADLSPRLVEEAKKIVDETNQRNIKSCDIVNAIDLQKYENEKFDVVLLFGPLYHLQDESERKKCVQEVNRILKKGGLIFASFIPYLAGSISIIDRYFRHPEQVNIQNLNDVFETGVFSNAVNKGFQEGYYASSEEIINLFKEYDIEKEKVLSIRGILYEKEDNLYKIENSEIFDEIINLSEKTAEMQEIIETCGHAMYIGKKL